MSDVYAEKGFNGQPIDHCLVIDAHAHIGENQIFAYPDTSLPTLIARMDRLGIACVCVSPMGGLYGKARLGNDMAIAASRRYPGRIYAYMCIDPGYPERATAEMQRSLDAGVRAVKIHSYATRPFLSYDSANLTPLYEFADAHSLPLLAHTFTAEELQQIEPQFARYQRVGFILAHTGACGLDRYIRLAREYSNVYLETCLSASPRGLVESLVSAGLAGKVLWGSDQYFMDASQQLGRVLFAQISEDDKRKILGANAARVFGIGGAGT
jgi:predicted TIM-barrel fold metal-dependent hydrolase